MEPLDALRTVPFLSCASDSALARLADRSVWRRLSRGDFLFHIGEPVDRIYLIASGKVAASTISNNGKPLLFHVAGPGETAGQIDLLVGGSYSASAQALTPVVSVALPAAGCVDLLRTEPASLMIFAQELAVIVRRLTESMSDLVFLRLERRLARLLVEIADGRGRVLLTITQGELAARLGVARQSVNEAIGKLAARNLVTVRSPREIQIVDRAALDEFIAGM